MLSKKLAILLAFVFIASVVKAEGGVFLLPSSSFDDELAKHNISLVNFFVPWCGYCRQLAPEFEKAAPKLKNNDPSVTLLAVDCTVEKKLCQKFGLRMFPTLWFFHQGQFFGEYEGPRHTSGIVKRVNEIVLIKLSDLKEKQKIEENKNKSDENKDVKASNEKVQDVTEQPAEKKTDQVIEEATEKVQDVKEQPAEKKTDQVIEEVVEKTHDTKEQVTEKVQDVKEQPAEKKTDQVIEEVTEKPQDVQEQIPEKVYDVQEQATRKVQDVQEQAAEKIQNVTEEHFYDEFENKDEL